MLTWKDVYVTVLCLVIRILGLFDGVITENPGNTLQATGQSINQSWSQSIDRPHLWVNNGTWIEMIHSISISRTMRYAPEILPGKDGLRLQFFSCRHLGGCQRRWVPLSSRGLYRWCNMTKPWEKNWIDSDSLPSWFSLTKRFTYLLKVGFLLRCCHCKGQLQ